MGSLKGLRRPTAKLKKSQLQMQLIPHLRRGGRLPCHECPLDGTIKVPPAIPPDPLWGAIGMHPGPEELEQLIPFVGPTGTFLREELTRVGLDVSRGALANLTRCRPEDGEGAFGTWKPDWKKAIEHCWSYLAPDLKGNYPLLLLGEPASKQYLGKNARMYRTRGLWHVAPGGRYVFVTWHPAWIHRLLREKKSEAEIKYKQFRVDLKRFADRILGRERMPDIEVYTYTSPDEAKKFLTRLASHKSPWSFDIETYDAKQDPSRRYVAVNPFHKDFRVRGVAISWRPDKGTWIELMPWDTPEGRQEASKILGPAFASHAEKWAFNSSFDENGLVYNKWVPRIRNLSGDGMRALIAINAGGAGGFSLERSVVEVLGEPQYWGLDKTGMRLLPIHQIANAAVRDASSNLKMCSKLHGMLGRGDYIMPDDEEELVW